MTRLSSSLVSIARLFIIMSSFTSTISRGSRFAVSNNNKWLSMRRHFNVMMSTRGGGDRCSRSQLQSSCHLVHSSSTAIGPTSLEERSKNLKRVREIMSREAIDAVIVPTDDPHLNEYISSHFARREFISGFTGSAGSVVITQDKALVFTDGRYHKQAEMELTVAERDSSSSSGGDRDGGDWTLMKVGLPNVPTHTEYLAQTMKAGSVVGIDPFVHSISSVQSMKESFSKKNIVLKYLSTNPIDEVWSDVSKAGSSSVMSRPSLPQAKVRIHPLQYAGKSTQAKLEEIRLQMTEQEGEKCDALVLTALDEIMWLLNIRGSDVPCNPISYCYCIVQLDKVQLFIDESKLDSNVKSFLQENNVIIHPYQELLPFLKKEVDSSTLSSTKKKIWIDPKTVNAAISDCIPTPMKIEKRSPIVLMKALKNEAELHGMRQCHLRDAVAFVEFLAWLEEKLSEGQSMSEYDIDIALTRSRANCSPQEFLEPSFATIAGVNENGAIIHYRAAENGCKMLTNKDMLLLDSGGQYLDGTTDVTRTFHFGEPSAEQREMYTRVLKGHIGIDRQIFPVGTPGCFLDIYAREHLWQVGKNFNHGTGHGVGAALNVHEGPQRISSLPDSQGLFAGMIVSNEPGYYVDNSFGIRIENLLIVVPRKDLGEFAGKGFLGFERLTQIPIQTRLLDVKLLTDGELTWLNQYHEEVRNKVALILKTERAKQWLFKATEKIER